MSEPWTSLDGDPRTESPSAPTELTTYRDYLRHFRLTLEVKCQGLTPEQLATRSVPPSTLSLLGLVRHMAAVEHSWFRRVAQQTGESRLFGKDDRRDADFDDAVGTRACVEEAFAVWKDKISDADAWLDGVPDEPEALGRMLTMPGDEGQLSIRDMLVHMIEEYARHCGHADLLRECLDGTTGA